MNSKKILVIENEPSIRKILADKLVREKFEVIQANNGEDGLKIALSEHPDLVLTDVLMPKMNGLEMINELHKDAWGKSVPIIILSNLNDDTTIVNQIKHTQYEYLLKTDLDLASLIDKIKTKLGL